MCEKTEIKLQDVIPRCQWLVGDLTRPDYNERKLSDYIHFSGPYLAHDSAVTYISFNNPPVKDKHFEQD